MVSSNSQDSRLQVAEPNWDKFKEEKKKGLQPRGGEGAGQRVFSPGHLTPGFLLQMSFIHT